MTVIAAETPGARVIGTEAGLDRIAGCPQLLELIGQFCVADSRPEACFATSTSIGIGNNSEVHEINGIAVKLSTNTTGRSAWRHGSSKPENLLNQIRFMVELATYFQGNEEVTAPEQYLALRSRHGAYLSVHQFMNGWESIQDWLYKHASTYDIQTEPVLDSVKDRIKSNVGNPLIRLGLEDLGLRGWRSLHRRNILVPADSEQIDDAQLCIIDQPSQGLYGHVAVAGLRVAARVHTTTLPSTLLGALSN